MWAAQSGIPNVGLEYYIVHMYVYDIFFVVVISEHRSMTNVGSS
jgi:hypothetical protein